MKKYITNGQQTGKIYIIGTPIGNIEDITMRAIKTLKAVDIIACEDTRVTQKLLNYYEINTKKTIYQKHNEIEKAQELVFLAKQGLFIGIVSDAGMPGIADPGNVIIRLCHEEGVAVEVIPGPTSSITGYIGSGIKSKHFTYYGFLSDNKKEMNDELNNIINNIYPTIIFVSPHKIEKTLKVISEINKHKVITICRELTKMYEEYIEGEVSNIIENLNEITLKGEMVIIIHNDEQTEDIIELPKLNNEILELLKENSTKNTSQIIADKYSLKKNQVYDHILEINKK